MNLPDVLTMSGFTCFKLFACLRLRDAFDLVVMAFLLSSRLQCNPATKEGPRRRARKKGLTKGLERWRGGER
jgi:hypothetical protein